jgi:hypothetical protein
VLLHAAPAAAAVVIDKVSVKPARAQLTPSNPTEVEIEVAIRDRGVTRILGCQLALDFGDGTPDLVQQFMDGGPRKAILQHRYRRPGTYSVRVRGASAGRERACEGEKRVQVLVVGETQSEVEKVSETPSGCPQGWMLIPGTQNGPRFKCRAEKPLAKIECQSGTRFFEQDGVIGCQ